MTINYMTKSEAKQFAERWLPAWSGNNPDLLASYYADDVFYLDPAVPNGIKGKSELLAYFRKLLSYHPNWQWTHLEGIPPEDGFLNKWQARIPVRSTTIDVVGVCLVQLDSDGNIHRNEVYFDRSALLEKMKNDQRSR